MKRIDLGIVMIHWVMVVILLGAAVSGILLWAKELQPYFSIVFEPSKVGVIHIGLGIAVVFIFWIYLLYQRHKGWLDRIALSPLKVKGRIHWRHVNVMLIWVLFSIIVLETITGILLTKLIDGAVLASVFGIQKTWLCSLHLALAAPVFAFPIVHVSVHWLDGRHRLIFSIFRPHVCPRKPSLAAIMVKLREENVRLKREKTRHESSLR